MNRRGFLAAVLTVPLVPMATAASNSHALSTLPAKDAEKIVAGGVAQGGTLGPMRVINVEI